MRKASDRVVGRELLRTSQGGADSTLLYFNHLLWQIKDKVSSRCDAAFGREVTVAQGGGTGLRGEDLQGNSMSSPEGRNT